MEVPKGLRLHLHRRQARAAGLRRTRAQVTASYATSPEAADQVTRALGGEVCLDRERGW